MEHLIRPRGHTAQARVTTPRLTPMHKIMQNSGVYTEYHKMYAKFPRVLSCAMCYCNQSCSLHCTDVSPSMSQSVSQSVPVLQLIEVLYALK